MQHDAHIALAQLSEDALQRTILELGRYALSVSKRLRWRTGDAVELPRGETIDSIVSQAFTKVLTGERRWGPGKQPELKLYLMNVIDSLLNHLAERKDNTVLTAMPDGGSERVAQPPDNPETALLQREQAAQEAWALQCLIDASQDDPLLQQMIHTMQAGHGKLGDIAAALSISVTDVYNAMKRLDRKIERVRQHAQQMP